MSSTSNGWRSRGWTPLAFPKSALLGIKKAQKGAMSSKENIMFPMHDSILASQVREMLLIDGTLNADTLTANDTKIEFKCSDKKEFMTRSEAHSKQELWTPTVCPKNKKRLQNNESKRNSPKALVCPSAVVISPEKIVDQMILRAFKESEDVSNRLAHDNLVGQGPRKISDADTDLSASSDASKHQSSLPLFVSMDDISRFIDIPSTVLRFKSKESMPPMLEASIATETTLREHALLITERILKTVANGTLKRYFGYPYNASVTRERLIQGLGDLWFDTSHAMFAFEQTEVEESGKPRTFSIRDTLFDSRTIRHLGGWNPSSILPQALSLRKIPDWQNSGKRHARFLAHHKSSEALTKAGQERRGNRLRRRRNNRNSEGLSDLDTVVTARSRSSSIESSISTEKKTVSPLHEDSPIPLSVETTKAPETGAKRKLEDSPELCNESVDSSSVDESSGSEAASLSSHNKRQKSVSTTTTMRLSRPVQDSWGVLLGKKDGNTCIVMRGARGPLQLGDQVIRVRNLTTNVIHSTSDADWFRGMIGVFKSSHHLELVVRREDELQ